MHLPAWCALILCFLFCFFSSSSALLYRCCLWVLVISWKRSKSLPKRSMRRPWRRIKPKMSTSHIATLQRNLFRTLSMEWWTMWQQQQTNLRTTCKMIRCVPSTDKCRVNAHLGASPPRVFADSFALSSSHEFLL